MNNSSPIILAVLIFLNQFFLAAVLLSGHLIFMRAVFIVGIILGLLACTTALRRTGSNPPRVVFAISGLLTMLGWSSFLFTGDASLPLLGYILIFLSGFLALPSALWLMEICPRTACTRRREKTNSGVPAPSGGTSQGSI